MEKKTKDIPNATILRSQTGEWGGKKEISPIQTITDEQILQAISCPGFLERFDIGTAFIPPEYGTQFNTHTQANELTKTGSISDNEGKPFQMQFSRDLDSVGICVADPRSNLPVIRLVLRDRHLDGHPESTSPYYLNTIGGVKQANIPKRSFMLGGGNWYNAAVEDTVPEGMKAVEFSIISSDPKKLIIDRLNGKVDKLTVSPKSLAAFIDDPFALIPFSDMTENNINLWWKHWYQVVQRGIREEKEIPYPGQTSQRGFSGFFDHVVSNVSVLLKNARYTHLSGSPTWYYVWHMNIAHGFQPQDREQHHEALRFFDHLHKIQFKTQEGKVVRLAETDLHKPLPSWFAVAPFMMALHPTYEPKLDINVQYLEKFLYMYRSMKEQLKGENESTIITYPLYPGRNLWHNKPL